MGDETFRGRDPTDPKASHDMGLGEGIDDDCTLSHVRQLARADMFAVMNLIVVNLIRDQPKVMLEARIADRI